MGEEEELDCAYYVLPYNLEKAKKQFEQAPKMLKAFEYWFGPYPFYEDSFKLVEVPYLGMEHQSSVTYGNEYQNGYRGRDLSGTGWGLKFDFIIIHESGHEWFANNITYKDIADMLGVGRCMHLGSRGCTDDVPSDERRANRPQHLHRVQGAACLFLLQGMQRDVLERAREIFGRIAAVQCCTRTGRPS